jgi:Helix-turn-helix family
MKQQKFKCAAIGNNGWLMKEKLMTDALAVSCSSRAGLVDAGGRFMVGSEMAARAKEWGTHAGGLYFRGRIGALGEVSSQVATAMLGIFPGWVIDFTWRETAALPASAAVEAYRGACADWGASHLSGLPGMARLADLAGRVAAAASAPAVPLFAAWQAQPGPAADGPRAAHALAVLRELRGGLHFAALRSHRLEIPLAVLADPGGGPARLRRTAWEENAIAKLQQRAAAMPDLQSRWQAAENATHAAFADQLNILAPDELAELAALINRAVVASRPHGTG